MAESLQDIQSSILFLSPKELEKAKFSPIKGGATRDYVIALDVPDQVKEAVQGSGILGGTLSQGEDYVFLEKKGDKDIATYTATLEAFYFKNLGKNQERVLVASFKRTDAIVPLKQEKIAVQKGMISQKIIESTEVVYQVSKQSYLNLVDLNPATNAVNLTNDLMIFPYMSLGGRDAGLDMQAYNLSDKYTSGMPDVIEADRSVVDQVNKRNKTKMRLILALAALCCTAIGLSLIPQGVGS